VFCIPPNEEIAPSFVTYSLPWCGVQTLDESTKVPVIVIQAEKFDRVTYMGVRYLDGGNGLCTDSELQLLNEPNILFSSHNP
jgi:hypothetical protein